MFLPSRPGADSAALQANPGIVADVLGYAEQQLRGGELVMHVDRMSIYGKWWSGLDSSLRSVQRCDF